MFSVILKCIRITCILLLRSVWNPAMPSKFHDKCNNLIISQVSDRRQDELTGSSFIYAIHFVVAYSSCRTKWFLKMFWGIMFTYQFCCLELENEIGFIFSGDWLFLVFWHMHAELNGGHSFLHAICCAYRYHLLIAGDMRADHCVN